MCLGARQAGDLRRFFRMVWKNPAAFNAWCRPGRAKAASSRQNRIGVRLECPFRNGLAAACALDRTGARSSAVRQAEPARAGGSRRMRRGRSGQRSPLHLRSGCGICPSHAILRQTSPVEAAVASLAALSRAPCTQTGRALPHLCQRHSTGGGVVAGAAVVADA